LIAERSCEHLGLVGVISHTPPIVERQACGHNVHANVDVQLDGLSGFVQTRKCAERLLQVSNGLTVGAPLYGPEPRLAEIGDRLLSQLSAQGVMGKALGLLGDAFGREPLDRLGDAGVQNALPIPQQPLVSDLVSQCVFERVLEVRKEPGLIEELCCLQAG